MRRNMMVLLTMLVLAFPGIVMADGSTLGLEIGYRYFDYQEDLNAPLKSTESGWLPHIAFHYDYKAPHARLYSRAFMDYASADLTFDGTTQGGAPVHFADSFQKFFKMEWNIGYVHQVGEKFQMIPYIGYGYRYWLRGKAKVTQTFRSFEEEYSWSYLPIGLKTDYIMNKQWSLGAVLAVNVMFNGKMKARISQVLSGSNDPEFDLGNKVGFSAEVPVTFRFTKNWALVGTTWYEFSQIGQSNTLDITQNNSIVGFAFEPSSRTHQYGIRLGASYSF